MVFQAHLISVGFIKLSGLRGITPKTMSAIFALGFLWLVRTFVVWFPYALNEVGLPCHHMLRSRNWWKACTGCIEGCIHLRAWLNANEIKARRSLCPQRKGGGSETMNRSTGFGRCQSGKGRIRQGLEECRRSSEGKGEQ
jgi:hypothetical protein